MERETPGWLALVWGSEPLPLKPKNRGKNKCTTNPQKSACWQFTAPSVRLTVVPVRLLAPLQAACYHVKQIGKCVKDCCHVYPEFMAHGSKLHPGTISAALKERSGGGPLIWRQTRQKLLHQDKHCGHPASHAVQASHWALTSGTFPGLATCKLP